MRRCCSRASTTRSSCSATSTSRACIASLSERFHLPQWDAAIERKLRVLDGIYEKLATRAASRRFEVLEVVIIVLIAVSTVLPFLT